MDNRIVPELPAADRRMRVLIDSDVANEIDDVYAIALALAAPDRFDIEGFVGTHFATSRQAGPESTEQSYQLLLEELNVAGMDGQFDVRRGGDPMGYWRTPSPSEGAELIVERARRGSEQAPLWVVCLGAATNLASALLQAPDIVPRVRCVFHARSEATWPERSVQWNVRGDVKAAAYLLESGVPLVWFDTGTQLCASMDTTARRLAPVGRMGRYLHDFRSRREDFQSPTKGFFDVCDIAWMLDPGLGVSEVVAAPTMDETMFFNRQQTHGNMLRVYAMDVERTWELFFERIAVAFG